MNPALGPVESALKEEEKGNELAALKKPDFQSEEVRVKATVTKTYEERIIEIKESNRKAMKKLCIAGFVSIFFIVL